MFRFFTTTIILTILSQVPNANASWMAAGKIVIDAHKEMEANKKKAINAETDRMRTEALISIQSGIIDLHENQLSILKAIESTGALVIKANEIQSLQDFHTRFMGQSTKHLTRLKSILKTQSLLEKAVEEEDIESLQAALNKSMERLKEDYHSFREANENYLVSLEGYSDPFLLGSHLTTLWDTEVVMMSSFGDLEAKPYAAQRATRYLKIIDAYLDASSKSSIAGAVRIRHTQLNKDFSSINALTYFVGNQSIHLNSKQTGKSITIRGLNVFVCAERTNDIPLHSLSKSDLFEIQKEMNKDLLANIFGKMYTKNKRSFMIDISMDGSYDIVLEGNSVRKIRAVRDRVGAFLYGGAFSHGDLKISTGRERDGLLTINVVDESKSGQRFKEKLRQPFDIAIRKNKRPCQNENGVIKGFIDAKWERIGRVPDNANRIMFDGVGLAKDWASVKLKELNPKYDGYVNIVKKARQYGEDLDEYVYLALIHDQLRILRASILGYIADARLERFIEGGDLLFSIETSYAQMSANLMQLHFSMMDDYSQEIEQLRVGVVNNLKKRRKELASTIESIRRIEELAQKKTGLEQIVPLIQAAITFYKIDTAVKEYQIKKAQNRDTSREERTLLSRSPAAHMSDTGVIATGEAEEDSTLVSSIDSQLIAINEKIAKNIPLSQAETDQLKILNESIGELEAIYIDTSDILKKYDDKGIKAIMKSLIKSKTGKGLIDLVFPEDLNDSSLTGPQNILLLREKYQRTLKGYLEKDHGYFTPVVP